LRIIEQLTATRDKRKLRLCGLRSGTREIFTVARKIPL
jgi:hypothetical protein